jgi:site-specific DNA recombinase
MMVATAAAIWTDLGYRNYSVTSKQASLTVSLCTKKKLGFWMGGYSPLGYYAKDRALLINESEAKTVRYIFNKFLELKSITATLNDLKQAGIGTRSGNSYSKKTLRQFLGNPIYKGFVSHKGTQYKGLHEAIIDEKTFEEAQEIFMKSSEEKPYGKSNVPLKDIIRCGCCDCAMTPNYCYKNNKKYRYYTCSNHLRKKSCHSGNKNVPAGEVEEFVTKAVRRLLTNPAITALMIHRLAADGIALDAAQQALKDIDKVWETLHFQEQRKIVKLLIDTVAVDNSGIKILLNHEGAHELIKEVAA